MKDDIDQMHSHSVFFLLVCVEGSRLAVHQKVQFLIYLTTIASQQAHHSAPTQFASSPMNELNGEMSLFCLPIDHVANSDSLDYNILGLMTSRTCYK